MRTIKQKGQPIRHTHDTIAKWSEKKGEQGLKDYFNQRNRVSIDGLPAVK
jgi:hypothetical protein